MAVLINYLNKDSTKVEFGHKNDIYIYKQNNQCIMESDCGILILNTKEQELIAHKVNEEKRINELDDNHESIKSTLVLADPELIGQIKMSERDIVKGNVTTWNNLLKEVNEMTGTIEDILKWHITEAEQERDSYDRQLIRLTEQIREAKAGRSKLCKKIAELATAMESDFIKQRKD